MIKFQAVAEKTAKNFRGLLFFAAPCMITVDNTCSPAGGQSRTVLARLILSIITVN